MYGIGTTDVEVEVVVVDVVAVVKTGVGVMRQEQALLILLAGYVATIKGSGVATERFSFQGTAVSKVVVETDVVVRTVEIAVVLWKASFSNAKFQQTDPGRREMDT